MKITLTKTEAEIYFHNALCNVLGTGYIDSYGIELTYKKSDYEDAKKALVEQNISPCYEDILMQILRNGKTLKMIDMESGMDDVEITMEDVHEKVANMPIEHLIDMIQENDDAVTADVLIQTVFYNDVIFG